MYFLTVTIISILEVPYSYPHMKKKKKKKKAAPAPSPNNKKTGRDPSSSPYFKIYRMNQMFLTLASIFLQLIQAQRKFLKTEWKPPKGTLMMYTNVYWDNFLSIHSFPRPSK